MCNAISAMAPGKIILLGEHAVVYGRSAIAVPVHQVHATAIIEAAPPGFGLTLIAADLGRVIPLAEALTDDPLPMMARLVLDHFNVPPPDATLTIRSTIPIASGLGSGAAVSTAMARALVAFLGQKLETETVSQLVYKVEKLYHGTPSGIDNTVVAFGRPVFFARGRTIEILGVGTPLHLVIGDTGVASPTRVAVGDVRRVWERSKVRYERIFERIEALVSQARVLIEAGSADVQIGRLMDENHALLRELDVTSPELERLVGAARAAGALGAKLSGAGRGGNMVALVEADGKARVAEALRNAGAVNVIETVVLRLLSDPLCDNL